MATTGNALIETIPQMGSDVVLDFAEITEATSANSPTQTFIPGAISSVYSVGALSDTSGGQSSGPVVVSNAPVTINAVIVSTPQPGRLVLLDFAEILTADIDITSATQTNTAEKVINLYEVSVSESNSGTQASGPVIITGLPLFVSALIETTPQLGNNVILDFSEVLSFYGINSRARCNYTGGISWGDEEEWGDSVEWSKIDILLVYSGWNVNGVPNVTSIDGADSPMWIDGINVS